MSQELSKLTAKELIDKLASGEVKSCIYSTKEELFKGMRDHATRTS